MNVPAIAFVRIKDVDDSVSSCDAGMISEVCIADNRLIALDKKFVSFMLNNWQEWTNSPEYPLYKYLEQIKNEMMGGDK